MCDSYPNPFAVDVVQFPRDRLCASRLRWLREAWAMKDNPFDSSAWMSVPAWQIPGWTVGASAPERRVPKPSYVARKIEHTSNLRSLKLEARKPIRSIRRSTVEDEPYGKGAFEEMPKKHRRYLDGVCRMTDASDAR